MRARLVTSVRETLSTAGYLVSPVMPERPASFDLIARRDDDLFVVKVLQNVDALSAEVGREMLLVARMLGGKPLLVGSRTSSGNLEPGVVYMRHDVPLLSHQTLEEWMLHGMPLLAFAAPGGFYVRLDGNLLRAAREERDLSLGQLASVAGVSRRAIRMYESGMSTVVDVAARLEQYLDVALARPIDPFERLEGGDLELPFDLQVVEDEGERSVLSRITRIGMDVAPTRRSPFQALARRSETTIITGVVSDEASAVSRSSVFDALSRVSERRTLFIVRRRGERDAAGETPVVGVDELKAMAGSDELLETMQERRERR